MEQRPLGKTGLRVSPLGFGAAELGYLSVPQSECDRILNGVLDAGINLIDTAASYRDSEDKVGRALSSRRSEFVLVTKCGRSDEELTMPSWSAEIIRPSAERSLARLRTDHLDVMLLHSCSREQLRNERMIEALQEIKREGLTRFIGYSGDGEDAAFALSQGVFDCLETSINICDQQVLCGNLPRAREAGVGVLAKRSLANAVWRDLGSGAAFYDEYRRPYRERLQAMGLAPESVGFTGSWTELAVRFSAGQPGVSAIVIGGTNLDHLRENIALVEKGPLPAPVLEKVRTAWVKHDDGSWVGQV